MLRHKNYTTHSHAHINVNAMAWGMKPMQRLLWLSLSVPRNVIGLCWPDQISANIIYRPLPFSLRTIATSGFGNKMLEAYDVT